MFLTTTNREIEMKNKDVKYFILSLNGRRNGFGTFVEAAGGRYVYVVYDLICFADEFITRRAKAVPVAHFYHTFEDSPGYRVDVLHDSESAVEEWNEWDVLRAQEATVREASLAKQRAAQNAQRQKAAADLTRVDEADL
jgi:hypothetical protein